MNLERELAATKSSFAHECDDVDRIMATLGIMTPRTECGSLRVNDIVRHIQETLDALAASHSASVAFSDKYAMTQRELAAYKQAVQEIGVDSWLPERIRNRASQLLLAANKK